MRSRYLPLRGPRRKIIPITEFVDAAGFLESLQKAVNEMEGKSKLAEKDNCGKDTHGNEQVHRQEEAAKERKLHEDVYVSAPKARTSRSMGTFQMKSLFLGMMHFQDEYTYDIHRVEKCDIHYAMPDGEVLPFCTFNVFPEVYRDKVQKQYSIPSKEWEKTHNAWTYAKDKYIRNVKELEKIHYTRRHTADDGLLCTTSKRRKEREELRKREV